MCSYPVWNLLTIFLLRFVTLITVKRQWEGDNAPAGVCELYLYYTLCLVSSLLYWVYLANAESTTTILQLLFGVSRQLICSTIVHLSRAHVMDANSVYNNLLRIDALRGWTLTGPDRHATKPLAWPKWISFTIFYSNSLRSITIYEVDLFKISSKSDIIYYV